MKKNLIKNNWARYPTEISSLKKKLEKEIRYRKNIEKELQKSEERLLESYKHLGVMNRQISILIDLGKFNHPRSNSDLTKRIVNSLSCVSGAKIVAILRYSESKKSFIHLDSLGIRKVDKEKFFLKTENSIAKFLINKKIRLQKKPGGKFPPVFFSSYKLKYFLFLPILIGTRVRGIIFLGFSDRQFISTQELDFYEAFTNQVSFIMKSLNILK